MPKEPEINHGHYPPPSGAEKLQGDNTMSLAFGEAVRIGSTPPTTVMAVTGAPAVPSVETIMTASPL